MSPSQPLDLQTPSPRVETAIVASSGVTVIVRRAPPPEPRRSPEPPPPTPRVVIKVPDPPARGRDALLARLFAEHGDFIRETLHRRRDVLEESKKDLGQRVLMVLCQHIEEERPLDNVRGFLFAVIRNEVRNHKRVWRPEIEQGADADMEPTAALDPEGAAEIAERWERLTRYLSHLTRAEAEVFRCIDLEGMTIDDAAETLQRPRGTVSTQIARARAKLEDLARASDRAAAVDAQSARGK